MRYMSSEYLENNYSYTPQVQMFSDSAMILKSASAKVVFLSHSSKDKPILNKVVNFLADYGATCYVDLDDTELPRTPSAATAEKLHREIERSFKLIALVSQHSSSSRWIPWEVGLGHAYLKMDNVAILPVNFATLEDDTAKQEYFGLYPTIVQKTIKDANRWVVHDPKDNKHWQLTDWLTNKV